MVKAFLTPRQQNPGKKCQKEVRLRTKQLVYRTKIPEKEGLFLVRKKGSTTFMSKKRKKKAELTIDLWSL